MTDQFCGGCGGHVAEFHAHVETPNGRIASSSSDAVAVLSSKDLEALIQKPVEAVAPVLSSRVSQNELDKLFGKAE